MLSSSLSQRSQSTQQSWFCIISHELQVLLPFIFWGSPKCLKGHTPKTLSRCRAAFLLLLFGRNTQQDDSSDSKIFQVQAKAWWLAACHSLHRLSVNYQRGSVQRQQFSPPQVQNQSQFEQRLMVKQKSEWKWRKTKVTAIRLCRCNEHRSQVLGTRFMPEELLSDLPYSIQP